MTFTQSIEGDLLLIGTDDPRTVRLFRRSAVESDPPGTDDENGEVVTGVHRVAGATDTRQAGGAVLPRGDARFHLQAVQLGYVIPEPGDVIEDDDGTRYSLDRCESCDNGTRYVVTGTAER